LPAIVILDTVTNIFQFLAKQTPQKPIQWLLKLSSQVIDNLQSWYNCLFFYRELFSLAAGGMEMVW